MTRQVIERDKLGVLPLVNHGGQGVADAAPNVTTKFAESMVQRSF